MPAASITTIKHICTASAGNLPSSREPNSPPAVLPSAAGMTSCGEAQPAKTYAAALTAQTGAITAIAVACASFWGYPKSPVSTGTAIIPPPPPNSPFIMPMSAPLNMRCLTCEPLFICFIPKEFVQICNEYLKFCFIFTQK